MTSSGFDQHKFHYKLLLPDYLPQKQFFPSWSPNSQPDKRFRHRLWIRSPDRFSGNRLSMRRWSLLLLSITLTIECRNYIIKWVIFTFLQVWGDRHPSATQRAGLWGGGVLRREVLKVEVFGWFWRTEIDNCKKKIRTTIFKLLIKGLFSKYFG